MGVVYEAHDPMLDRAVALKVVPAAVGSAEDRKHFESRFFAEARIAARLSHPGIVLIHDVGRDDGAGVLFLALELLRGATLAETVKAGALPWREALRIVAAVAEALQYAHARKVVHLDLKPANIMLLPGGQPKLMDFGLARIETARLKLTASGPFFGTPLFMSPEHAQGRPLDARSDIFSLGAVLYTLLTAGHAFAGENVTAILARVIGEEPPPPSRVVPDAPAGLDEVVARALAKSPGERYPAAGMLAEDAQDLLAGRPPRHARGFRAAPLSGIPPAPAPSLDSIEESELEPLEELLEDTGASPPAPATGNRGGPDEPTWVSAVALPPTEVRDDRERHRRAAGRRRLLQRGAIAAAIVVVGALLLRARATPGGAPAAGGGAGSGSVPSDRAPARPVPSRSPARATNPTRLLVDFEHPLRAGRLQLWLDERLLVDRPVAGQESRKLLVTVRSGSLREEVEVPAGRHDIRVQVSWDGNQKTERIFGTLKEGETRRLEVRLGRVRKNLSVDWR
jgi:hypothetical protein